LVKCNENGICEVVSPVEQNSHYLDTYTNTVITCASNGNTCILEDPSIKGYFKNSDSSDTDHKIIECTASETTPCSVIEGELDDDCTDKIGKVLTSLKLCISDDINDAVDISTTGTPSYKTIEIKQNNDFPGTNAGTISVIIGNDGSAILLEDTGLPSCTSIATDDVCFTYAINGQYCIHSDNKIYKTTISGETKKCELLSINSTQSVYFNDAFEVQDMSNDGVYKDTISYLCTYNSDTYTCEFVKGYIINTSKYIQCSGWKREGCAVASLPGTESCSGGEGLFKINSSNNKVICFGNNDYAIPSTGTDYVAFKAEEINPLYGSDKNEIVFLSVSTKDLINSVIVTKDSGNLYRYKWIIFLQYIYFFSLWHIIIIYIKKYIYIYIYI